MNILVNAEAFDVSYIVSGIFELTWMVTSTLYHLHTSMISCHFLNFNLLKF